MHEHRLYPLHPHIDNLYRMPHQLLIPDPSTTHTHKCSNHDVTLIFSQISFVPDPNFANYQAHHQSHFPVSALPTQSCHFSFSLYIPESCFSPRSCKALDLVTSLYLFPVRIPRIAQISPSQIRLCLSPIVSL